MPRLVLVFTRALMVRALKTTKMRPRTEAVASVIGSLTIAGTSGGCTELRLQTEICKASRNFAGIGGGSEEPIQIWLRALPNRDRDQLGNVVGVEIAQARFDH